MEKKPVEERFFAKTEWGPVFESRGTRCLLWQGGKTKAGYGLFKPVKSRVLAHRWLYMRWIGEVPAGLELDHLCRTTNCVNPDHLEAVTPKENILRSPYTLASINKIKTHCPQNHPYDEANTIHSRGRRKCKACEHERWKKYVANKPKGWRSKN